MKNFLITLGVALAACAVAFGVFYAINDQPALRLAARDGDAMAWLRAEFRLSDAQFADVKKLHDDYSVRCGEHCAAIMAAKQRVAPAAEIAALEKTCVEAMTGHFDRVAALLPPGEGARYLAMVLPRITDFDHNGAPTVQVRP
ncbi:MAG: hypothetical protein EXS32_14740 [Opitutus sp.]|nr:hypothetical protein [Opitutus sp.]